MIRATSRLGGRQALLTSRATGSAEEAARKVACEYHEARGCGGHLGAVCVVYFRFLPRNALPLFTDYSSPTARHHTEHAFKSRGGCPATDCFLFFFFSVFLVSLFSLYISLSCSFPCLNKFVSICVPDSGRKHKNTGRARRQLWLLKTFLPQIPLMFGVSA